MDGTEKRPGDDAESLLAELGRVGVSRREFARRVGAGSAVAAAGFAWTAPRISTIKYAAKVVAGSGPPTSTTTTTTTVPIGPEGGHITVSNSSPCVGDKIHVSADGFAPKTAVTLEIDSDEHVIGVVTANGAGKVEVEIQFSKSDPTGVHNLKAVGVQTGGRTQTLTIQIHIKTEAECAVGPEATTTTVGPGTTTTTTTTTPTPTTTGTVQRQGGGLGGPPTLGSGGLAFTGTDAIDLALIGGAAAIGGRALYGLARRNDEDDDEEEEI